MSDSVELVVRALASLPILDGCSDDALLRAVCDRTSQEDYERGKDIPIGDGFPMYVVLSGSVQVCVSCGPSKYLAPGDAFNSVGMLGFGHQAERYRPQKAAGQRAQAPGTTPTAAPAGTAVDQGEVLQQMCPHGAVQLTPATCGHSSSGWLRLTFTVASSGGCTLAVITRSELEGALQDAGKQKFDCYQSKLETLERNWMSVLRSFVFPGMPPEVAWMLAQTAELKHLEAGEKIAEEGEVGESADGLIIIEEGEVVIEKLATLAGKCTAVEAGVLGPGAIVGDACLVGAKIPRPAALRARTAASILLLPRSSILATLRRFPGITACMKARLRETAIMVQPSLPAKADTIGGISIFAKCKPDFLRDLSRLAERRMFCCGDVIREEGVANGKFFVLEFGLCTIETQEQGIVGTMSMGHNFGQTTLKDPVAEAKFTVRVASPLALMLNITADSFHRVLGNHPNERIGLETVSEHEQATVDASQLEILQRCGKNFAEEIGKYIETRCFMPGRTITVGGAIDAGSMFVVRGGRAAGAVSEFRAGDAFGELAMLGLVRRRISTVRALNFCILQEIPRAAFLSALEKHPEEREHFEDLSTQHGAKGSVARWPFFPSGSGRVLYLINLLAERRITQVGAWTSRSGEPLPIGAAVLVLQGILELVDQHGHVVDELTEGQCFNEQALIGWKSTTLAPRPKTSCEVQIMTPETFERIMKEFPKQVEATRNLVVHEMAGKAEKKLGLKRESVDVLRLSAILNSMPADLLETLRPKLIPKLYAPDVAIMTEGEPGKCMYWLLDGGFAVDGDELDGALPSGTVMAEGAALGITRSNPATIKATDHSIVFALEAAVLQEELQKRPDAQKPLEDIVRMGAEEGLQSRIRQNQAMLTQVGPGFVDAICHQADDVFFAPGTVVLKKGTPCVLGRSCMYLVLSGKATIELDFDVKLDEVNQGGFFGVGGALGLASERTGTVRAWKTGLLHCARFRGNSVKSAKQAFPDQFGPVLTDFEGRTRHLQSFVANRRKWLNDTVAPALQRSPIFAGFTAALIYEIAQQLEAVPYGEGEHIFSAGTPADSMVILVGGEAELTSKTGQVVGRVTKGAILGEASVLGLLPVRTSTLISVANCEVLTVTASSLKQVLASDDPEVSRCRKELELLRASRNEQVRAMMPLSALQTGDLADEVCVHTVAIHAERLDLAPGSRWQPVMDSSPNGPRIGVLSCGRASLLVGTDTRPVMSMVGPTVVPEGLAAANGAYINAVTQCEAYRFYLHDMLLASSPTLAAKKWFKRFDGLMSESEERMRFRLESARGAAQSKISQLFDSDVNAFKDKLKRVKARAHLNAANMRLDQSGHPRPTTLRGSADWNLASPSRTSGKLGASQSEASLPQRRHVPAVEGEPWRSGTRPFDSGSPAGRSSVPLRPSSGRGHGLKLWRDWSLKEPSGLCLKICEQSWHSQAGFYSHSGPGSEDHDSGERSPARLRRAVSSSMF